MLLTITEAAETSLQQMLEKHDKNFVTLAVLGGGCSGFKYEWGFADTPTGNLVGTMLSIDPMAEMFLYGCTVDYVQELGGSYLTVVNPNATASCGCGESFAV